MPAPRAGGLCFRESQAEVSPSGGAQVRGDVRGIVRALAAASVGVLLVFVAACGGGDTGDGGQGAATSPAAEKMTTYTNAEYGFSVTYDERRFDVFDEQTEGSQLVLFIADSDQTDGPAVAKIAVGAAGSGEDCDPGSPQAMESLRAVFAGLAEDFTEADVGEPEECTLGGLPALCTYVGGSVPALAIGDRQVTTKLYSTRWADKVMLVLMGTPSPVFGENEAALTKIVDSITIDTAAQ